MSNTAEEIKIIDIIANQLGVDKEMVTPGANIVDDLGADSLDVVELVMALEEAFDIEFPERMLNRRSFSSMNSIAACINELRPQALAS